MGDNGGMGGVDGGDNGRNNQFGVNEMETEKERSMEGDSVSKSQAKAVYAEAFNEEIQQEGAGGMRKEGSREPTWTLEKERGVSGDGPLCKESNATLNGSPTTTVPMKAPNVGAPSMLKWKRKARAGTPLRTAVPKPLDTCKRRSKGEQDGEFHGDKRGRRNGERRAEQLRRDERLTGSGMAGAGPQPRRPQ